MWNIPGPPHHTVEFVAERSRVLDAPCADLGRDPREITRSVQLTVSYDDPAATRAAVGELVAAGMNHVVLNLPRPYPPGVARWPADEVIAGWRPPRADTTRAPVTA